MKGKWESTEGNVTIYHDRSRLGAYVPTIEVDGVRMRGVLSVDISSCGDSGVVTIKLLGSKVRHEGTQRFVSDEHRAFLGDLA